MIPFLEYQNSSKGKNDLFNKGTEPAVVFDRGVAKKHNVTYYPSTNWPVEMEAIRKF